MADVFHCLRSESGVHVHDALRTIQAAGCGVLVYLRQEIRGARLGVEVRDFASREPDRPGGPAESSSPPQQDLRLHGIGAQILRSLGVGKIRLLTNHPIKIIGLQGYGLSVVERVPLIASAAGVTADSRCLK